MSHYPFPVAAHSYFRIRNQERARELFLAAPAGEPRFEYVPMFDEMRVAERLAQVKPGTWEYASLDLVLTGCRLQNDPAAYIDEFRKKNRTLFGEPSRDLTYSLLGRVKQFVTFETADHWRYICDQTGYEDGSAPAFSHDDDTFMKYRQFLYRYMDIAQFEGVREGIPALLERGLSQAGLADQGWRVKVVDEAAHARVHHAAKTITVGGNYQPRRQKGALRVVVHEVYGHALRGHQQSIAEGEGFAIFLEQLLDDQPRLRRSYRYIAAALGWGIAGTPMSFRDVYEIIWRVMMIMGGYAADEARRHAFDECVRVFRGGRPDIPGAVYLKDSVYLPANLAIWSRLAAQTGEYDEFVDMIEGRRKVLG